jgi:hypothetical protein
VADPPPLRGFSGLRALARGGARLNGAVERVRRAGSGFTEGLLSDALDVAEMERVTVALYDLQPASYGTEKGLQPWESDWYDECLPQPPARLLVTAAGAGREVKALLERGYAVDCFEPVPAYLQRCAAGNREGLSLSCDYAAYVRAMSGDGGGPAAAFSDHVYDAVILGWGSFTHLLAPDVQREVLKAAVRSAPEGPVLASFFTRVSTGAPPTNRAERAGHAAGRALGRWRGASPAPPRVRLFWHLGFTVAFAEEDLTGLADAVGREVRWWPQPYGHATFDVRVGQPQVP